MWCAVKAMAMRLRYAAAPSPSTTSFARHLNRWLHHLSDKIKNGLGLLIPPSMTWKGGDDYDDGSEDGIPMEFYFFDELIVRGTRRIGCLITKGPRHSWDRPKVRARTRWLFVPVRRRGATCTAAHACPFYFSIAS